jgi:hypothetical protein
MHARDGATRGLQVYLKRRDKMAGAHAEGELGGEAEQTHVSDDTCHALPEPTDGEGWRDITEGGGVSIRTVRAGSGEHPPLHAVCMGAPASYGFCMVLRLWIRDCL